MFKILQSQFLSLKLSQSTWEKQDFLICKSKKFWSIKSQEQEILVLHIYTFFTLIGKISIVYAFSI